MRDFDFYTRVPVTETERSIGLIVVLPGPDLVGLEHSDRS